MNKPRDQETEFERLEDSILNYRRVLFIALSFILGSMTTFIATLVWINFSSFNIRHILFLMGTVVTLLLVKVVYCIYRQEKMLAYINKYNTSTGTDKIKYFFKILFQITFSFPKYKNTVFDHEKFNNKKD